MAGRPSQTLKNAPNRIREVREAKGMTLKAVGKLAGGWSERRIQGYETGENKIRVWQLERVARALGVPSYSLLNDYDAGQDEVERAMLNVMRRLPHEKRGDLLDMAASLARRWEQQKARA